MNTKTLNDMLRFGSKQNIRARIGEKIVIQLPRVPLTRHTEFVAFERKIEGEAECVGIEPGEDEGEGHILPRQILGKAVRTGKMQIRLEPIDAVTREHLQDVDSIVIDVEVEE